jgi:hypothetical protein
MPILYQFSHHLSRTIVTKPKIVLDTNKKIRYNILMKWTTDEKQFLKKHYNDMSTEDIASKLGRNPSNIASQIYYLRKRGWTFNSKKDKREEVNAEH